MYSKILVALDGSDYSLAGGEIALSIAEGQGSEIIASHIYDAKLHSRRFQEMEPVLPDSYQNEDLLSQYREAHKDLIFEGFEALSKGYLERFLARAKGKGIPITQDHREGRHYIRLLEIAAERSIDLVVLGAYGLGSVDDDCMGSAAIRVLRSATCDVLLTRHGSHSGNILAGIDGSREALDALRTAVFWAGTLKKSLHIASAYDPCFHSQVFKTMAGSLSTERQDEVGLNKQEALHEQFIDRSLERLYQIFLDQALEICREMNIQAEGRLLQGKAYQALLAQSQEVNADLVVVSRYGHHHDDSVDIGSNAEALARRARINVLVTSKTHHE
ncbi:universal stress protein [Thermodesulfobacteriota bacterium]